MHVSSGLSRDEAQEECDRFNERRTASQRRLGTKMEFEEERRD
jgi:hypothetical protein